MVTVLKICDRLELPEGTWTRFLALPRNRNFLSPQTHCPSLILCHLIEEAHVCVLCSLRKPSLTQKRMNSHMWLGGNEDDQAHSDGSGKTGHPERTSCILVRASISVQPWQVYQMPGWSQAQSGFYSAALVHQCHEVPAGTAAHHHGPISLVTFPGFTATPRGCLVHSNF